MNFNEIEDLWADTDEELEKKIIINQPVFNTKNMKKIKSNLVETRWDILLELAFNIPFLGMLQDFCYSHLYQPKFLVPGLFLLLLTILTIIFTSYKLFLLSRINRNYPIIKTQRNLTLIQYFNRLEINSLFFSVLSLSSPSLLPC